MEVSEKKTTQISKVKFKLSESQFQSLMAELSMCQDLFHSSLTWQLVFPQNIISWKLSQEVLLTSWLRNSQEKSLRTLMVMICSSSMRTYSWLRRMTEQACSEKVFNLLIFRREDSMLKIKKNHELTWRISSMMVIETNWIMRFWRIMEYYFQEFFLMSSFSSSSLHL